jgi:hypothetical protein
METVEEVGSKLSLLHHGIQVAIRRGNDPHADGNFPIFTDTQDAILLEHSQQLCLEGTVQLADLIEEEDTAFGGTNQAFTIPIRAGKRPAPVTEQFALRQAGTDRTAVDGNERPMAPLAIQLVDGMGQELLPRPCLPRDQDREVTQCAGPTNRLEDSPDGLALSHTS